MNWWELKALKKLSECIIHICTEIHLLCFRKHCVILTVSTLLTRKSILETTTSKLFSKDLGLSTGSRNTRMPNGYCFFLFFKVNIKSNGVFKHTLFCWSFSYTPQPHSPVYYFYRYYNSFPQLKELSRKVIVFNIYREKPISYTLRLLSELEGKNG